MFRYLSLLFLTSCASIHEIQSISQMESWIVPDALVLFDLDNTVFEGTTVKSHANWYHDQIHQHPDQADKVLKRAWKAIQSSGVRPVEKATVELIHKLQKQGVRVMALTARNPILIEATLRQLKSINVDFSKTSLLSDSKYLHEGVIFIDNAMPKGLALKAFLKKVAFQPKRIVMVDDVKSNLESICKYNDAIGLYYPVVDNRRDVEWDEQESERHWLLEEDTSSDMKNARPGKGN